MNRSDLTRSYQSPIRPVLIVCLVEKLTQAPVICEPDVREPKWMINCNQHWNVLRGCWKNRFDRAVSLTPTHMASDQGWIYLISWHRQKKIHIVLKQGLNDIWAISIDVSWSNFFLFCCLFRSCCHIWGLPDSSARIKRALVSRTGILRSLRRDAFRPGAPRTQMRWWGLVILVFIQP